MKFDYIKICTELLNNLSAKQNEVITRRFALIKKAEKEALAAIGQDLDITRERVRQIEKSGLLKLKPILKNYQEVFDYFKSYLKEWGNLRKEELLLAELADGDFQNEIYFLLTLSDDFERVKETNDFYSLWLIDRKSWDLAQKVVKSVCEKFKKINQPLSLAEINKEFSLPEKTLTSYLETAKNIQQNDEGLWGLKVWPEINPRRVRDRIYLALKKNQTALHFTEIANLIKALPQTVHNELIKDNRFVLVGRGIYALKEWGYQEGTVKDLIRQILKEVGQPLSKEEILERVLKQRMVKKNTILLNLNNKNYFSRDAKGHYQIREA
ncbi:MAG: sigma factor-like helix-turn-helix DNA-binding protein [Minisyncoccales bacterium]